MPEFNWKEGWHPKGKQGGKESWRGDFKGINQVAGWMGKGKDPHQEQNDRISRPLSTLKDPSSFGPPPKNVNFHGGVALSHKVTPDTRGWGAPLSEDELQAAQEEEQAAARAREGEAVNPPPPSGPYKADTTGLSTSHLPKPPAMRVDVNEMKETGSLPTPASRPKPKPSLPPRLPPRQNSNPTEFTPAPPPSYDSAVDNTSPNNPQLNQGALNRLGNAGVSVPGLNIGASNPWKNEPSSRNSPAPPTNNAPQLSEFQSRFSKLSTSPNPEAPAQGTTWEQKQTAMKTASSFHKDPSSVSMSDARTAASTANNFRERHGDQIASAKKSASNFNQKYGITNRLNSFASTHSNTSGQDVAAPATPPPPMASPPETSSITKKKPPPPPPPKKPSFTSPGQVSSPPPLPMGTKPRP